ncbi:MAG: hypothetical protein ACW976_05655 [Candidatus Ranarchaeia archaeon]
MPGYPKLRIELQLACGILEVTGDLTEIQEHMEEIIQITKKLDQSFSASNTNFQRLISNIQNQETSLGVSMKENENLGMLQRDYSKMSLRERIEALLTEGVFDKPITAQEVRLELESRGVYHETRRIASELTRSFVRRNQIRRLGNRGKFSYVKA